MLWVLWVPKEMVLLTMEAVGVGQNALGSLCVTGVGPVALGGSRSRSECSGYSGCQRSRSC